MSTTVILDEALEFKKAEIMADFDFEKVHKAMTATDWKYSHPEPAHIPDIDELKRMADMLLTEVLGVKDCHSMRTGGFEAWRDDGGDDENPSAGLTFWFERSEVYL